MFCPISNNESRINHFFVTFGVSFSTVTVTMMCFLQMTVMKTKLDVVEKMFRVRSGVMVVDTYLSEWLKQILAL